MLHGISKRSVLPVLPIFCCTAAHLAGADFCAPGADPGAAGTLVPWLFSLSLSCAIPSRNLPWQLIGGSLAFFLSLSLFELLQPGYAAAALPAALFGPLAAALVHPWREKGLPLRARIFNRSAAVVVLMAFSAVLTCAFAALYAAIRGGMAGLYLSDLYRGSFSYIYGIIYQFCAAFGFGNCITGLPGPAEDPVFPQSFFSVTEALFAAGLPAVYLAMSAGRRRRAYGLLFFPLAILSSTYAYSVAMLLVCLLWVQPWLFGMYLLTSAAFYFVGYRVPFAPQDTGAGFYDPDIGPDLIAYSDPGFLLFAAAVFAGNFLASAAILHEKRRRARLTGQITRVKPLIVDILADIGTRDVSLQATGIIKALGSFDNVISVNRRETVITFAVISADAVDFDALGRYGTAAYAGDGSNHLVSCRIRRDARDIHAKILEFAAYNLIDVTGEYREIEPYSIDKGKFGAAPAEENAHALDPD